MSDTDHPLRYSTRPGRTQALYEGHIIADSADVVELREADLAPVLYFARQDVEMAALRPVQTRTQCPYKGEASYFTVYRDGRVIENAAWSYEHPKSGSTAIAGRIAFDPKYFDFHTVHGAPAEHRAVKGASVDDVVRHTDSGSGASQADHWAPNVDETERPGQPYQGTGSI